MTSKTSVRETVDGAETSYRICWDILVSMKSGIFSDDAILHMLDFQTILATALFSLDKVYLAIAVEKQVLVTKKPLLVESWFRQRMKKLSRYQEMLVEAIGIGKSLGDSFAWFFYQNARKYLQAHAKHEILTHLPPGDGGLGELEFIRNFKHINGDLVIYHGTTTFLRLGDVSLINLKTMTVTAIGDIKTARKTASELEIQLYFVGQNKPNEDTFVQPNQPAPTSMQALPEKIQQKLEKQMEKMAESFVLPKIIQSVEIEAKYHTDELNDLSKTLSKSTIAYRKAGDGLLLVGLKRRRSYSLYANLFGRLLSEWADYLSDLPKHVVLLCDSGQSGQESNTNSITISHLVPHMMIGAVPMFWWPVEIDMLRRIFFREVVVFSIYNPAHLARKLRSLGFEVSLVAKGDLAAVKYMGDKEARIEGIRYFTESIRFFLLHEEFVVTTIAKMLDEMERGTIPVQSRMEMAILQTYGRSTQDTKDDV